MIENNLKTKKYNNRTWRNTFDNEDSTVTWSIFSYSSSIRLIHRYWFTLCKGNEGSTKIIPFASQKTFAMTIPANEIDFTFFFVCKANSFPLFWLILCFLRARHIHSKKLIQRIEFLFEHSTKILKRISIWSSFCTKLSL